MRRVFGGAKYFSIFVKMANLAKKIRRPIAFYTVMSLKWYSVFSFLLAAIFLLK